MDVKLIIGEHPLALPTDISYARKAAKHMAERYKLKGIDPLSVKVTWTPNGKLGGKLFFCDKLITN